MLSFHSIHAKFLSWISTVLVLVVGGFGGSLYFLVRHARLEEIDTELAGTAQLLAESLRPRRPPPPPGRRKSPPPGHPEPDGRDGFHPRDFDGDPGGPRFDGPFRPPPGRGRSIEEVVAQLEVPESLQRRIEADEGGLRHFAIWSPGGDLLRSSRPDLEIPCPDLPPEEGASDIRERCGVREHLLRGPRGALILTGKSMGWEIAERRRLAGFLALAGAGVLAIGFAGAWFISKRALRPIRLISETVEEISASNLDRRIDLASTEAELGGLARVLNSAFDRLQESIERQVRFSADASHELRTPLSVILAQTSMGRRKTRSAEEYLEVIETCHAAAGRMKTLVDGLMTLARTHSGELQPRRAECDFRQLADECIELMGPLALETDLTIRQDLADVTLEGDAEFLVQVVSNLLSNAIRYNRQAGEVRVSLRAESSTAVLTVADTGVGIPAGDLPRIFDRFYRVDRARSRRDGGTGLGLAIAHAIVHAHGGTIACESSLGEGATFTVRLPLRAPSKSPPPCA